MNEKIIWHILEQPHSHHYIEKDDYCLYTREYVSGYGYQGGPTNRLILNFKKSPNKKRTPEWKYRIQAVETFKTEAEKLFKPDSNVSITAIPSSKQKTHPDYDWRFEDLFATLLKSRPNLSIKWPIKVKKTEQSSHRGGRRNPEEIKENYIWKGFEKIPKRLCIFDDVLTTGAHFRAFSYFLKENGYTGQIIGTFWSRAISLE